MFKIICKLCRDSTLFKNKISKIWWQLWRIYVWVFFTKVRVFCINFLVLKHPNKMGWLKLKEASIYSQCIKTLMFQSHIPISICFYAISHDVHPIKFLPSSKLNNESPYYVLFKKHSWYISSQGLWIFMLCFYLNFS
jgi:hypothetical protein